MGDLRQKFEDFGWNSLQVDGHDVQKIYDSIELAKKESDKPSVIILDTVKGKGWSVTEGKKNIHYMFISAEQL